MSKYNFIPGLELNRKFFFEIIKPLMDKSYPDLIYSASLIGYGSDVLGLDNETSMDHNWGPRCQLFLNDNDIKLKEELPTFFANSLPLEFLGFPTNYTDPEITTVQMMEHATEYPIRHLIEIDTFENYVSNYLGVQHITDINNLKWVGFTDQQLLEVVSGEVFHDGLNKLTEFREYINFYPHDVLKLKLASLWSCISNEEAFIGRSIELDDLIGLKMISSRIINYLLKICVYLDGKYIPYSKWFGSVIRKQSYLSEIRSLAEQALIENDTKFIEDKLSILYLKVLELHNSLDFLPKLDCSIKDYHGRPYKVVMADQISDLLLDSIQDEVLRTLNVEKILLDIKIDSVDFTE